MQKVELEPKAESQTQLNSENSENYMQEQPGNTPSMSNIVAWSNVIMFNTI